MFRSNMIIEKYGKVKISESSVEISEFVFNCRKKEFCLDTAIRRALYFARGIINRNLKELEGNEDYAP